MSAEKEPRLSTEHVDFFYGQRQVLHDLSIRVRSGEYLSLIGPNGSGKSTLFRLLGGLEQPQKGEVLCEGRPMTEWDVRGRARRIAMVRQNAGQAMPFTCLESVLMGLHPHLGRFEPVGDEGYTQIRQLMELTDTWRLADQLVTELSGGERQRVALCRALAQRPKVLLLDEAMSELDIAARMRMSELLRQRCREDGLAVIAIHHDLNLAYRYSDRVFALSEGRCAGWGSPGETMTEELFRTVFHVKAEIFADKGFFIQNIV